MKPDQLYKVQRFLTNALLESHPSAAERALFNRWRTEFFTAIDRRCRDLSFTDPKYIELEELHNVIPLLSGNKRKPTIYNFGRFLGCKTAREDKAVIKS